jgi:hypothetical protein
MKPATAITAGVAAAVVVLGGGGGFAVRQAGGPPPIPREGFEGLSRLNACMVANSQPHD